MLACAITLGSPPRIFMKGRGQDFDRSQLWTLRDVQNYLALPDDLQDDDASHSFSLAMLESRAKELVSQGLFGKDIKLILQTFLKGDDYSFFFTIPGPPDLRAFVFDWREWREQKERLFKCAITSTSDWRDIPSVFKHISSMDCYKIQKKQGFQQEWAFAFNGFFVVHVLPADRNEMKNPESLLQKMDDMVDLLVIGLSAGNNSLPDSERHLENPYPKRNDDLPYRRLDHDVLCQVD